MFINEKLHSPLFGYSNEIKLLYKNICDLFNKKLNDNDVENVKIDYKFNNYTLNAQKIELNINLNDLGIDIIKLSKPIKVFIYNIIDNNFEDFFIRNRGTRALAYGSFDYSVNQYIKDDIMYIDANDTNFSMWAYKGKIDSKSFYILFYHEFNHLYRRYNILKSKNDKESNKDIIQANVTIELMKEIKRNKLFSDDDKDALCDIVYMLLDKDELYAFANSIKGELISLYKKSNFNIEDRFKETQIYKEFNILRHDYEYIENMSPETLYRLCIIFNNVYERYNYKNKFKKCYDNGDDIMFKEKLLYVVKRNLDLFKRQIMNMCGSVELMENYKYVGDIKRGRRDGKDMWMRL